ncbi:MAG: response regulator [Candidatus Hydrogenedentes bacterium]|nr:response regulator [Candidatus Hydrogenedentota bacterium]
METLQVLVCDDEMGMRVGVMRALREFTVEMPDVGGEVAFEVSEAESGEQALERIQATPPHILLLDHKLPGVSGIDVLEQIAPKKLDMHTIMITAYASIETAVRATKQGAYDFLPKPFTPGELRATVRKAANHLMVARQARKLAEEKRRVRFEFIRVVAHELKSPINAVEGYLNILKDGTAGDDPKVQQQIIERCTTRIGGMRKMITDLLDLTRIESGQKPREIEQVDIGAVARIALETATPDAQARDITLSLTCEPAVTMPADRSEIEIILNNLISNAVKYNHDGGRVDVSVGYAGGGADGGVVIAVADTGIGMSKEDSARLFNDFVRIKNEKTQGILGSGLGLSILKKLADLYEGAVTVQSEPGAGSTFTVTLRKTATE